MAVSKKPTVNYSVDRLMRNVASSLIRDFQTSLGDPSFAHDMRSALRKGSVEDLRGAVPTTNSGMSVPYFKAAYQLSSLFKRYRFKHDLFTDSELEEKAIASFRATQDRLAAVDLDSVHEQTHWILDEAARYISVILGKYDPVEHGDLCRFGKRASVGVPSRKACEAERWELPISGSQKQVDWFVGEILDFDSALEYIGGQLHSDPSRSVFQVTETLKLTLVPKTFKSLRSIMPNTTIGSYMSFGLGEMMRLRLKRGGYDIKTLQQRHRVLAREASIHGMNVTADLSAASDSITVPLVKRLFPADWFEILEQSRIKVVQLPDGSEVQSLTYCTMGIGYTFPLQTLVFLALLKAIEAFLFNWRGNKRTISVYGDDMIYHCRQHFTVLRIFDEIGFVINVDKTFFDGQFRESCGGDYYRGVDVRPFQPQNGPALVGRRTYEAILYKYINGLLMRWDEYEIESTLQLLTSELERVTNGVKSVPCDYPDDAGIRCTTPACHSFMAYVKLAPMKNLGHGVIRFSYLRLVSETRKEQRHGPYLWVALRRRIPQPSYSGYGDDLQEYQRNIYTFSINELCGCAAERTPLLITQGDVPVKTFRGIRGTRLRRTSTYVTVSNTGKYERSSGTSSFGCRR